MKELAVKLKKFFNHITVKQILMIIIFGLLIGIASSIIGYIEFSNTLKDTYNNESADIANFIKENLDISEFEADIKALYKSYYDIDDPELARINNQPGYQNIVKQSKYLQDSIDGLDIFIASYDESLNDEFIKHFENSDDPYDQESVDYVKNGADVVCCYYRSKELVPDSRRSDYPGGLFLADGVEQETLHRLYETKSIQYFNSELIMYDSNASFTTFAVEDPILNNSGDVIGFVYVSITTDVVYRILIRYLILVSLLTIGIGVIFIIVYILINRRLFLKPILAIISGTQNFVKNNNQVTESLAEIKTGDEIQMLAESILQMQKDINEYIKNLAEVTKERERVQAELDLATNIQMSMLPQEIPEITNREEFDISAIMHPAREVGGDFYNYFMIDDNHLGFVVGDVSGKGVPAALFMMIGTIIIKTQSLPKEAVNIIMEHANDILSENNAEMLFITSWMGIYEISTNTVTFVNAGHEPPLLVHENGEIEFVETKPNLALATFGGLPYRLNEIKLKKGDKIFLYTDGVVEAQNDKKEFYKNDRLVNIVKDTYQEDVKEIIRKIREDIDVFVNGAEQFDDLTIVGLEVKQDVDDKNSDS